MKKLFIALLLLFGLPTASFAAQKSPVFMNPEITGPFLLIEKEQIEIDYKKHLLSLSFSVNNASDRTCYLPILHDPQELSSIHIQINGKEAPFETLLVDYPFDTLPDYKKIRLYSIDGIYEPSHYSYQKVLYRYDLTHSKKDTLSFISPEKNTMFLLSANQISQLSKDYFEIKRGKETEESFVLYSQKKLSIDETKATFITIDQMIQENTKYFEKQLDSGNNPNTGNDKFCYNLVARNIDSGFQSDSPYFYLDQKKPNMDNIQLLKFNIPKGTKTVRIQFRDFFIYDNYQKICLNRSYFGNIKDLTVNIIPPESFPYINSPSVVFLQTDSSFVFHEKNTNLKEIEFIVSQGNQIYSTKKLFYPLLAILGGGFVLFIIMYRKKKIQSD